MSASRKTRALGQRILLLRTEDKSFSVLGTSGVVYRVNLHQTPTCTCPDYNTRGGRCKHIYFVLCRVLGANDRVSEQTTFTEEQLDQLIQQAPPLVLSDTTNSANSETKVTEIKQRTIEAGECCAICCEEMNTLKEQIVFCKSQCGKSVHALCYKAYVKASKQYLCVYCRSPWKS